VLGLSTSKLPKNALERVHLGQSFAEYDTFLERDDIFVRTPALAAAANWDNPHCFFVGRRGTGKTTVARYVERLSSRTILIRPELFSPSTPDLPVEQFMDAKQRPFRSLVAAFRRSLQDELLLAWRDSEQLYDDNTPTVLRAEIDTCGDLDFDLRAVQFIDEAVHSLTGSDDQAWLTSVKLAKQLSKEMANLKQSSLRYTILLDAIDDSWDGSEIAVIYLTALMHAALEVNTQVKGLRVLVFIRENIFERVRQIDSEFARLETCVVGLDWSQAQLLEMVERRLNAPLTAKLPLGGTTWDAFFENGLVSRTTVFTFCQSRPRDVLTYTGLALDDAQARRHDRIHNEDLASARRRFSDSRLKDLGDEYQENYPQISLVLSRFYGLGGRWTLRGLSGMLDRLLSDKQVKKVCQTWIYGYSTPEQFAQLLYNIGFLGFSRPARRSAAREAVQFRSLGPSDTTPPAIRANTDLVIHSSYWDALDLQDVLVQEFSDAPFGRQGLQMDLPGSVDFDEYRAQLEDLLGVLRVLPTGADSATAFEDAVGDVLKLCFFRSLANVEPQVRDSNGIVRRDWVAANRASTGFWEMMRHRYGATQVIFEVKNYEDLGASDFQQAAYYFNKTAGRLVLVVFRGELKKHYYQHVKRIADMHDGLLLLLNDKDLQVFVRQALNGKVKDDHLQDRFDRTARAIS
jgi:hypothetical protein